MFLLDNNWWGESADNGIKLDLGERVIKPLKDEGGEIALNDRTPNALCVGATGARQVCAYQPHPIWAHLQLSAQRTVHGSG